MQKFLQKIFAPIVNFVSARGVKIGETPLLNVYKKVYTDGHEILRTVDKTTGDIVKIVENFPEVAGNVAGNSKFFQAMNRRIKVTDFRNNKIVEIMLSKINPEPTAEIYKGKPMNFYSPTTEVARVQKRELDLRGNWMNDVEVRVNKPGCHEFAGKHEVYPNNFAYYTSYEKGKAPQRIRSSITNICRSLSV